MKTSQGQSILDQAYNAVISIHNRDPWAVVPDAGLFHYTTAEGLLGIIQSGCLHASLAYLLNDASEVSYGCDIVLNAVAELRKTNRASALAQRILDDLLSGFSFESRRATWAHSIFVACFCEKDNLLSNGEPGGYSLGMAFSTSDTRLHPEPKTYTVGSGTGAVLLWIDLSIAPRFLWECLVSRSVSLFPAPASSNAACEFLALRSPACFMSRVM
jgi:hypothetical protein